MKPIKFRALILTAALAATPALAMIPLAGSAKAASAFPVVIELFTSQGCSSCPPADDLLGKLAKRADAVCLTLPVDYWDHLGWKDTLASPANSKRQWAYARSRGDRSVYTPQVVVNGIAHVTGHDALAIDDAIAKVRQNIAHDQVAMTIERSGDILRLRAGAGDPGNRHSEATFWLVLYAQAVDVAIKRGENAGKKIRYFNVVREMSPVGMWHGKEVSIELSQRDLASRGHDGGAVLLQAGPSGPIIGAVALSGL